MSEFDNDMLPRLRIGAVSYLNTKPLVYGLADLLPDDELIFDLPSRLADSLISEELDIALVPSIELADHPEWRIISDACIGCVGPVLSVKLLFRKPPSEVRTLALDEGSRTSAVLAQILLSELYGVHPKLKSLPIGEVPEEIEEDAILVIGDRAIRDEETSFVEVWDLGERWNRWTKLPMVFAMWVARANVTTLGVEEAFHEARDNGCQHLEEISLEQAKKMQLPVELVQNYLRKNLHFHLGTEQLKGLESFYHYASKLNLISEPPILKLDDCPVNNS